MLWLREVKIVSKRMEPIKVRFTEITVEDRGFFKDDVIEFKKRYFATGPGTVGADLEKGLQLLDVWRFRKNTFAAFILFS